MRIAATLTALAFAASAAVLTGSPAAAIGATQYASRVEARLDVENRLSNDSPTAACMARVATKALAADRVPRVRALKRKCTLDAAVAVGITSKLGPAKTAAKMLKRSAPLAKAVRKHDDIAAVAHRNGDIWTVVAVVGKRGTPAPEENQGPYGYITLDTIGDDPREVYLDASNVEDGDGTIVEYRWEHGPRTNPTYVGSGKTLTHVAPTSGTQRYTMIATDDDGATATFSETIDIEVTSPYDAEQARRDIVTLTNSERAKAGVGALGANACLMANAQRHAEAMAITGGLYHQDMSSVRSECGLTGWVGENVVYNLDGTGTSAVAQWMSSEGHRANILDPDFQLIGVGLFHDAASGRYYAVQVFAGGVG